MNVRLSEKHFDSLSTQDLKKIFITLKGFVRFRPICDDYRLVISSDTDNLEVYGYYSDRNVWLQIGQFEESDVTYGLIFNEITKVLRRKNIDNILS